MPKRPEKSKKTTPSPSPADLRDRNVTIRFDRNRLDKVIVFYKNQRSGEARKLDLIANAQLRRGGK